MPLGYGRRNKVDYCNILFLALEMWEFNRYLLYSGSWGFTEKGVLDLLSLVVSSFHLCLLLFLVSLAVTYIFFCVERLWILSKDYVIFWCF